MGPFINKSVGTVCRKKSAFIPSFLGQVIALGKAKLQRTSYNRGVEFLCGNLGTPLLNHSTYPLIRSRAVTSLPVTGTVLGYCDSILYPVFL